MTREEEIKKIAIAFAIDEVKDTCNPASKRGLLYAGFVSGAEWADAHPKQIEISLEDIEELAKEVVPDDWVKRQDTLWEMIRRNQRAQFIDKACEWLDCYIDNYLFIDAENKSGIKWDNFINDFRKAMKGGEK